MPGTVRTKGRQQPSVNWLSVIVGIIFLSTVTAGGTAVYFYRAWSKPVDSADDEPVYVTIAAGTPSQNIGRLLHQQDLIHHPVMFNLYVRRHGLSHQLQAGEYLLSPAMSLSQIVDKLARGDIATHPVTVPEGLTVRQTLHLLAKTGLADEDELRAAVDLAAQHWPYWPKGQAHNLHEPLEGYLFPDTYQLPRETNAEEIVQLMLQQFEKVFSSQWRERAQQLGLSIHEVVTLASIVEREAQKGDERATIAGVFHNRLQIGMKLDADPTVIYGVAWDRPERSNYVLTRSDLRSESPYNTYVHRGLPPGPIASPGVAALEAVLYPADVDYLYFVSKFDGTGAHVFARTYAEHRQNVARYRDGR